MNKQLERVSEMIRKTIPKTQVACFDGCVLYMDEHCSGIRGACIGEMEKKFEAIDKKLDKIIGIVGGNGKTM